MSSKKICPMNFKRLFFFQIHWTTFFVKYEKLLCSGDFPSKISRTDVFISSKKILSHEFQTSFFQIHWTTFFVKYENLLCSGDFPSKISRTDVFISSKKILSHEFQTVFSKFIGQRFLWNMKTFCVLVIFSWKITRTDVFISSKKIWSNKFQKPQVDRINNKTEFSSSMSGLMSYKNFMKNPQGFGWIFCSSIVICFAALLFYTLHSVQWRRVMLRMRTTCWTSWSIWCKTYTLRWCVGFSSTLMASRSACVWLQCPARETGPGCVMQGPWPGPFAPRAKDQVRKIHQRGYATCAWLAIKASLALIAILKQSGYPLCTALLPLLLGKRKRLWQGSCHSGQVSQQSDTALTCSTTGIWALARTFVLPPWWCFCRCAMDPLWWRSLRRWPAFGDLSAGLGALESIYLKSKTCVGKPAQH